MNDIWTTEAGVAALAYSNNNLALAKAFLAGYLYGRPEMRQEFAGLALTGNGTALVEKPTNQNGINKIDLHDDEASFNFWWNLYDKKRGRRKAFLKWKSLPLYKRRDCIAATPDYVKSTPDVQYRKDPQTYLNNESYYDELIPTQNEPRYDPYAKAASILAK
jgi:hypothetical protein